MNESNSDHTQPAPLVLTRQQLEVTQALKRRETEKYPLSQWYLGALYAMSNHRNPDCISQAAHSLRELMEKLPRVLLESDWFERRGRPSSREQGQMVIEETGPAGKRHWHHYSRGKAGPFTPIPGTLSNNCASWHGVNYQGL